MTTATALATAPTAAPARTADAPAPDAPEPDESARIPLAT